MSFAKNAGPIVITIVFAAMFITSCAPSNGSAKIVQGIKTNQDAHPIKTPVEFTYGLKNEGDEKVVYNFNSSKQWDLWIERANKEVFRLSDGKMYAQALTEITIGPGELKTFTYVWDQKDKDGKYVGPGTYNVYAGITPAKNGPDPIKASVVIGGSGSAIVTVTVADAIKNYSSLAGRTVEIDCIYKGWKPNPEDENTKDGPPVTRSDWAVCDNTGCIYVTGAGGLDPVEDFGTEISLLGQLKKSENGQIYLTFKGLEKK